jgi:hypothetical protein
MVFTSQQSINGIKNKKGQGIAELLFVCPLPIPTMVGVLLLDLPVEVHLLSWIVA